MTIPAASSSERAILVGVREKGAGRRLPTLATEAEDSLEELAELAQSAGASVQEKFLQVRERLVPATLVGRGKLEEIRQRVEQTGANLLLFDFDLTSTQQRNIESLTNCRVVDRTQLILDIFARHAHTREGQLQVELAQLSYLLPRLSGRGVEMSRLGGGIGTRGPGETQLEMDRRRIRHRIRVLTEALETVRQQRLRRRQRRQGIPMDTLTLVGYTNAGKSTLFNQLTRAQVLTSPQLFATLDPTLRVLELPSHRRVLVSDTVGFIRNLPHTLVKAFRATLEEVCEAQMILLVSDCAVADRAQREQQVEAVLQEIGAINKPILRIWNKIDLLDPAARTNLPLGEDIIRLSAKTGEGIAQLLQVLDRSLNVDPLERIRLRLTPQQGRELSQVYNFGQVLRREEINGMILLEANLPRSLRTRLQKDRIGLEILPR
ncbi:MAG: GTPase HflX [Acidobacteria bacterium]|nr:GTPase HflX [Acidobacteriota bacterium]